MRVVFPRGFPFRGEIYWASADKTRPVLIVSEDRGNQRSNQVVVAGITTTIYEKRYPVNVLLPAHDPLPEESEVRCRTLTTLHEAELVEYRARLTVMQMREIDAALRVALAL